ncbi:MAG: isoprenylcysteine carboxylmethyltransferase family protein [Pseudomonadota bacterium]
MTDRDAPDILIFPPLAAGLAVFAAIALEWLAPLGVLPPPGAPALLVFGIILLAAAIGVALWGIATFRAGGTNVDPRQPALRLVEGGPFRFTRNPMYLGMVLFQLGLALAASLDWSVMLAPLLWGVLHFGVVLREEAYLTAKFGAPYTEFLTRTRRWL